MSFLSNLFTRRPASTGSIARNRLQILLAHERGTNEEGDSALIQKLQTEIMEVLAKHFIVDKDKVNIKFDRKDSYSTLEIDIEVPEDDIKNKEK